MLDTHKKAEHYLELPLFAPAPCHSNLVLQHLASEPHLEPVGGSARVPCQQAIADIQDHLHALVCPYIFPAFHNPLIRPAWHPGSLASSRSCLLLPYA